MAQPKPPAAYLRAAQGSAPDTLARQHAAVAEAANGHGWPEPRRSTPSTTFRTWPTGTAPHWPGWKPR